MSPIIDFSQSDILRSKIVEPAWYRIKIDSAGEKASKDGGSTNWPMDATIVKNAETGSEEFAGVPVSWNFNSKAKGFMVGFFAALTGNEPTSGARYELKQSEGKEVEVYIKTGSYNGSPRNEVEHKYRACRE